MNILIISEGPPPLGCTPAEGGALRVWGLAKGLAATGLNVTIAYRSNYLLSQDYKRTKLPNNISLTTWDGDTIDRLLDNHKIVVMRYAMGEAEHIVKRLSKNHILVSDSYIPISIEVSARNSKDKDELINYFKLQESSEAASQRADYFLYASPAQKNYYVGYLAAISKINPLTYKDFEKRLFEVPYGIDKNDIVSLKSEVVHRPTLLWYGAFYSWFNMEPLIKEVTKIKQEVPNLRFLVAGAKNPYNKDPSLLSHYKKTLKMLEKLGDTVEMIEWTPYGKRFEIYSQADAIITFNHLGLENELAWRTRLMDYVLAYKPIMTNAGDPLGEDLIKSGVAFRVNESNIALKFIDLLSSKPNKNTYEKVISRYSWTNITKELATELYNPSRLPTTKAFKKNKVRTFRKIILLPYYMIKYTSKHGVKKSAQRAKERIKR